MVTSYIKNDIDNSKYKGDYEKALAAGEEVNWQNY
jgi:hypothetical protein